MGIKGLWPALNSRAKSALIPTEVSKKTKMSEAALAFESALDMFVGKSNSAARIAECKKKILGSTSSISLEGRHMFVDAMLYMTQAAMHPSVTELTPEVLVDSILKMDRSLRERHNPASITYVIDGKRLPMKEAWEARRRAIEIEKRWTVVEKLRVEVKELRSKKDTATLEDAKSDTVMMTGSVDSVPLGSKSSLSTSSFVSFGGKLVKMGGKGADLSTESLMLKKLKNSYETKAKAMEVKADKETHRLGIRVSKDLLAETIPIIKEALRESGSTVIRAEADAEMDATFLSIVTNMIEYDDCWGSWNSRDSRSVVVTDDGDALTFGAELVLRSPNRENEKIVVRDEMLRCLKLSNASFILTCILAGCDYGPYSDGVAFTTVYKFVLANDLDRIHDECTLYDIEFWRTLLRTFSLVKVDSNWVQNASVLPTNKTSCHSCGRHGKNWKGQGVVIFLDGQYYCRPCARTPFLREVAARAFVESAKIFTMESPPIHSEC